ncbi:MAG: DNA primase [Bacteroidetes bacterium]|nr:MAG: DNA primase [Bacteroidota bacterium]
MPVIPRDTVQKILDTARIEDVVQDFVNVKRRGVNLIGLCPFHNEKTPSFTVSPSKNLFKCFGCGVGGDVVRFVMEHEHYSYPEALRYLAKRYNIEIEEVELTPEMRAEQQLEESLFIVNDYAARFFQEQLLRTDLGKSVGLGYFKERGFLEKTIERFGLGYLPPERDLFTRTALAKGYKKEFLQKLGLTTAKDLDFFRGRVIFPIHNLSGKVIAFAGRILQKDARAPKYVNSPESEIYHKSKILYGVWHAKRAIRQADECILVEGYTDVISLHQAGIENVVASSGTSLTVEQIRLVKRLTPNIKILYDGDPAGVKAALRGLDLVLEQDMNVKVVLLPQGEDPDSYLRKVGVEAFRQYLQQEAADFILFKARLLLDEVEGDPVKRAGLVKDIVASIARVPDPLKRAAYLRECSVLMEMDERALVLALNREVSRLLKERRRDREREERLSQRETPAVPADEAPPEPTPQPADPLEYQERDIARLLVAAGGVPLSGGKGTLGEHILQSLSEITTEFKNPRYGKVLEFARELIGKNETLQPQKFVQHPDEELSSLAVELLYEPYEYSPGWEERYHIYLTTQKMPELNYDRDVDSALKRFKFRRVLDLCLENQQQLQKLDPQKDAEEVVKKLKIQKKLYELRDALARELRTVVVKGE